MRNTILLRKVMDHIEAHPETWRQDWWRSERTCGTAFCFAGWAVELTRSCEAMRTSASSRSTCERGWCVVAEPKPISETMCSCCRRRPAGVDEFDEPLVDAYGEMKFGVSLPVCEECSRDLEAVFMGSL